MSSHEASYLYSLANIRMTIPRFPLTATAHGKVILSGEHSVVYGHPAVVMECDLAVRATLVNENSGVENGLKTTNSHLIPNSFVHHLIALFDERYGVTTSGIQFVVSGDLPIGKGLGSSAALAYAVLQTLANFHHLCPTVDDYLDLVQASEQKVHGRASGVDAHCVVNGGIFVFHNAVKRSLSLPPQLDVTFFLIDSGQPQETTADMVAFVRSQSETNADVITKIGQLTDAFAKSLEVDKPDWQLLDQNGTLLERLGVVTESARQLSDRARAQGAYVKITGAGGRTDGSGMVLAMHRDKTIFEHFLQQAKIHYRTFSPPTTYQDQYD